MPPNIIVFFSDDHAQWALPGYGNSEIVAPNITHLAETGALMQNAFTPCPVCSPARASFWTGLYPSQHGIHDHLAEDDEAAQATDWLAGIPTLADNLHAAGYTTALCGKWHCGSGEVPKPGFDFWYSAWRKTAKYHSLTNKYSDQGRVVERRGYDTQIITDAAIDFMRTRDRGEPFFLFVGYAITHNPWINRPERLVSQYRGATFSDIPIGAAYPFGEAGSHPVAPPDRREALAQYYASVTMIDEGVGRVLDELTALGERERTLIVYTSDHGLNMGHHGIWGKGNGSEPLNMLDESIRVPLILNYPAEIAEGQRRDQFVTHVELHQTLRDYGEARAPGKRFRSLRRLFSDDHERAVADGDFEDAGGWRNLYFGEYGPVRAIRDERFKLILRYDNGQHQLHDLELDPRETVNLYANRRYAAVRQSLSDELEAWFEAREYPGRSGLLGNGLPRHNRREAWRSGQSA